MLWNRRALEKQLVSRSETRLGTQIRVQQVVFKAQFLMLKRFNDSEAIFSALQIVQSTRSIFSKDGQLEGSLKCPSRCIAIISMLVKYLESKTCLANPLLHQMSSILSIRTCTLQHVGPSDSDEYHWGDRTLAQRFQEVHVHGGATERSMISWRFWRDSRQSRGSRVHLTRRLVANFQRLRQRRARMHVRMASVAGRKPRTCSRTPSGRASIPSLPLATTCLPRFLGSIAANGRPAAVVRDWIRRKNTVNSPRRAAN